MCGTRSLYDRVREGCNGIQWVTENDERGRNAWHRWKDKFVRVQHLQRAVDVGRVRTLIWCGRCAGRASENMSPKRSREVCRPGDSKLA